MCIIIISTRNSAAAAVFCTYCAYLIRYDGILMTFLVLVQEDLWILGDPEVVTLDFGKFRVMYSNFDFKFSTLKTSVLYIKKNQFQI